MNRLLTEQEIKKILEEYWAECNDTLDNPEAFIMPSAIEDARVIAKAQDKKSVSLRDKQWIEEIEKFSKGDCPVYAKCMFTCDSMTILGENCIWWQSLKREWRVSND